MKTQKHRKPRCSKLILGRDSARGLLVVCDRFLLSAHYKVSPLCGPINNKRTPRVRSQSRPLSVPPLKPALDQIAGTGTKDCFSPHNALSRDANSSCKSSEASMQHILRCPGSLWAADIVPEVQSNPQSPVGIITQWKSDQIQASAIPLSSSHCGTLTFNPNPLPIRENYLPVILPTQRSACQLPRILWNQDGSLSKGASERRIFFIMI